LRNAFLTPCSLDLTSLTSRQSHEQSILMSTVLPCNPPACSHRPSPHYTPTFTHSPPRSPSNQPQSLTSMILRVEVCKGMTRCWLIVSLQFILTYLHTPVYTAPKQEWKICYCLDNTCFPDPLFAVWHASLAVSFVTYASALFQMQ
jgi:hypothetical protein